jgi:hypothetical protein
MKLLRRRSVGWLGALLGVLTTSCGPGPVVVLTGLEIVVAEGDGQFGAVGQVLGTPLRAVVRTAATQEPQEDVSVLWEIRAGGATLIGPTTVTTDATGGVEIQVKLGAVPEEIVVTATVARQMSAKATFTLHAVNPPELTAVTPASVAAGDTITLTGVNFSPVAEQDVVLFSGVRGRVVGASGTELRVLVPRCLPARDVAVQVQLGVVATDSLALVVTGGSEVTSLLVGQDLDVADPSGFDCFALEGGAGVQYLTLVYSASDVAAAIHPFELTGLSSTPPFPVSRPAAAMPLPEAGEASADAQALLDDRLRTLEGFLRGSSGPVRAPPAPAGVPTVGQVRTFHVFNGTGYDEVTAEAKYVGSEAAVFVDQAAPAGGFTTADLQAFAARFDDVMHPVVTDAFGSESDLDGNQRVIMLFTPVVNAMTPRGSSGFIGGFFFGNDLLNGSNSNQGEVFYALVPDPTGLYSDPRQKSQVLDAVPAVLAHEFQHMVHFNQRYLALDGGQESLWLSEALAQMAEELVARRYLELGDATSAELFRSGTRARAKRYLASTDSVSLIVSAGQGTLAERGGGFLFVLYLEDQAGPDLLRRLTATTLKGVGNVEAEYGDDWHEIVSDWWSAIYLDGPGPESGPWVYPDFDLRAFLGNQFPLNIDPLGPDDSQIGGLLWSSSVAYFISVPDPGGTLTVRLGGEAGGPSAASAALRMRIIRIS